MLLTGAPESYGMALPTGVSTLYDLAAKVPLPFPTHPCTMHQPSICAHSLAHSLPPSLPPSSPIQIGLDRPVAIMDVGAQEELAQPNPVSVSEFAAYLEAATTDHKVC
jgi:hypothetical protein